MADFGERILVAGLLYGGFWWWNLHGGSSNPGAQPILASENPLEAP